MTVDMENAVVLLEAESDSETEDIRRCLVCLYGTRPGEQALDREFGVGVDVLSQPTEQAKSLLTAEIVRKTARYEPRAQVQRVEWIESDTDKGVLRPKVVVKIV